MAWLRIDDRFTEHPKLIGLSREDRWTWMEVLTYCARARSGVVPDGISDVLKHVTEPFLERCQNLGLLDEKRGVLSVHDWEAYNPKDPTAANRMARMRDRNKGVTGNVTVTAPRPVPSHESKDSVRPDVSKVCQDCGETIGYGHLESCPRMPRTLEVV